MSSVLIVDDESPMREILVRWLASAGYETREAADADAALEALTASPADVVLCDVQMPGHDGLWLVARMRERFPDVAVVLATADDTVPPAASLQPAIIEYLVKPLSRGPVLSAVRRGVEWRRAALARGPQPASDALNDWLNGRTK
jgi:two-component system nitrogen regulation response regulator GlnG